MTTSEPARPYRPLAEVVARALDELHVDWFEPAEDAARRIVDTLTPAWDALYRIAAEDYRGPRPWSVTVAQEALAAVSDSPLSTDSDQQRDAT